MRAPLSLRRVAGALVLAALVGDCTSERAHTLPPSSLNKPTKDAASGQDGASSLGDSPDWDGGAAGSDADPPGGEGDIAPSGGDSGAGADAQCVPKRVRAELTPEVVTAEHPSPNTVGDLVVVDGTAWFSRSWESIMAAPTDGGPAVEVFAEERPHGLAYDDGALYWMSGDYGNGLVRRAVLPDGEPETVGPGRHVSNKLHVIAFDEAYVYWTNMDVDSVTERGTILRATKAGGTPTPVVTRGRVPGSLAVDETSVYWLEDDMDWWISPDEAEHTSTVLSMPKGGGPVVTLASGKPAMCDMIVDDTDVYWTHCDSGAVRRVPKGGGEVRTIAVDHRAKYLAQDAATIYWVGLGAYSAPKVGCGYTVLVEVIVGAPHGIALDDQFLYWTTNGLNGTSDVGVARVPR